MSVSYYPEVEGEWNDGHDDSWPVSEQECKRCRGTGSDDDGADCVFCEGMGSVIPVFPTARFHNR